MQFETSRLKQKKGLLGFLRTKSDHLLHKLDLYAFQSTLLGTVAARHVAVCTNWIIVSLT